MGMMLPSRLLQQPQQATQIDWSNPLTRGLVGFWLPMGNSFVSAIAGMADAVVSSGGSFSTATKGRVLGSSSGGVQTAFIARDARWQPTSALTMIAEGVTVNSSTNGSNYWLGNEDSGGGFGFYGSGDGVHPYLKVGSAFADKPSGVGLGVAAQVGMTFDGSTFYTVANGARSNSQSIIGAVTNANTDLALTAKSNGDTNKGSGSFLYLAIWNRALSPTELASFYANPWQVFRAPPRRIWAKAIAAPVGNAYTMPTAQGSYAITGNPVSLRAARRLAASAGAYAVTGNAAVLKLARRLVAATGAYSIMGNAASLIKGTAPRALQAAGGNYIITGNLAALRVARRLQAAPGSYQITGFAVADRVVPVVTISVRFNTLPRDFRTKTIHFSN